MKTSQKQPTLYLWDVAPHRMPTPKPEGARACRGELLHGAGPAAQGWDPDSVLCCDVSRFCLHLPLDHEPLEGSLFHSLRLCAPPT